MKKYTWSFEENAERYDNDVHDTIDGCITKAHLTAKALKVEEQTK